jgi:hypothetical protein
MFSTSSFDHLCSKTSASRHLGKPYSCSDKRAPYCNSHVLCFVALTEVETSDGHYHCIAAVEACPYTFESTTGKQEDMPECQISSNQSFSGHRKGCVWFGRQRLEANFPSGLGHHARHFEKPQGSLLAG